MSSRNYANSRALIEPEELVGRIGDEDLTIIELDVDDTEYRRAHIPGSVFWSVQDLLDESSANLVDPVRIQNLLECSGLNPHAEIVIAHNSHRGTSGWLYWFLARLGHSRMRVLNGGKERWLIERRTLTSEETVARPGTYPVAAINPTLSCGLAEVSAAIQNDETILLDVRTQAEFDGQIYLNEPPKHGERAGHIPGAKHLHCEEFHQDNGSFRTKADILALLRERGIDGTKQILPYCAIGARSAHVWFVLTQLLGWSGVRNFDGSWREWTLSAETPVE